MTTKVCLDIGPTTRPPWLIVFLRDRIEFQTRALDSMVRIPSHAVKVELALNYRTLVRPSCLLFHCCESQSAALMLMELTVRCE